MRLALCLGPLDDLEDATGGRALPRAGHDPVIGADDRAGDVVPEDLGPCRRRQDGHQEVDIATILQASAAAAAPM